MKLATWNVNSLRVRLPRVMAWLAAERPDVLCLQEIKLTDDLFPLLVFREAGWHVAVHGQKTYNGVAIVAREPIVDVRRGLRSSDVDDQSRCIAATVGGIRVVNLYVPNGQAVGSEKFAWKLRWLGRLGEMLARDHRPDEPLAVCGDFNVAPEDRDCHDPERWRGHVLFSEEEKAALRGVCSFGLRDALRERTQDAGLYTWWDYRAGSFHRGFGLRIDHILLTDPLVSRLADVRIDREARKGKDASDHAPVVATLA